MEDSHWNGCVDKKCYAGRGLAVPGCRCRMREVRVEGGCRGGRGSMPMRTQQHTIFSPIIVL